LSGAHFPNILSPEFRDEFRGFCYYYDMELSQLFDKGRGDFFESISQVFEFFSNHNQDNPDAQEYDYWDLQFLMNDEREDFAPSIITYQSYMDFALNYQLMEYGVDDDGNPVMGEAFDMDGDFRDDIFSFFTIYLWETCNGVFYPISSSDDMDRIIDNCMRMGVSLPEYPTGDDYRSTVQYYWELCSALTDYQIHNGKTMAQVCAELYG